RDAAGNQTTSAIVAVTVNNSSSDTTPPVVSMTAPSGNATVSGRSIVVSASASDNVAVAGVQFKLDGGNLGAEKTTAPYSIPCDTTQVSIHDALPFAIDPDGTQTKTTTAGMNVIDNNSDTTPPVVSMTAPNGSATVSGPSVVVSASASDNVAVAG